MYFNGRANILIKHALKRVYLLSVKRFKAISLLLLVGVLIFPWRLICVAHPFGHSNEHHEPGKLSPCELRKQYKGTGPAFFPPMHCHNASLEKGDFQTTGKFQLKPAFHAVAIAALSFEFNKNPYPQQPCLFPPEPACRSAPVISTRLLRAPPFCYS